MPLLPLKNGGSLAYREAGAGQSLLLLHGWSMSKGAFDPQFENLAARFHLVAPDLRGHGASSPVNDSDDIATLARDVAELAEQLDLSEVVLVGWSMGAMVAWHLMRGPAAGRIAGSVVIDMVPKILSDDSWPFGLREGKDASAYDGELTRMRADWSSYTTEFVPQNVARGRETQRADLLRRLSALAAETDAESMAILWRSLASQDMRDFVCHLQVPSLIAYGELSQLHDRDAFAWMERNIPDSVSVSFKESGHSPHLEESHRFNQVLEQFAAGLRGEPANDSKIRQDNSDTERLS